MKGTEWIFAAAILICLASTTKAQDERCFNKGTSAINLGVGIGSRINYVYGTGNGITPIYNMSYEYGVAKAGPGVIGIGISASSIIDSYTSSLYFTNYTVKTTEAYSVLGLRAAYHPDFCNGKKYDVYGAIQLNIYCAGSTQTSDDPKIQNSRSFNVTQILPSLLIGARYYFVPNFGVYGEFGYDFAILKAGVSFKFGGNKKD
ncbi:MAG TPA: hypothetical protein VF411_12450 [Bacteroidia bacterium]